MDVKSSDRFGTIRITGNDLACGQVIRHTLQLFRKLTMILYGPQVTEQTLELVH